MKVLLKFVETKDGSNKGLRNFGNYSPNDTALHPRNLESPALSL